MAKLTIAQRKALSTAAACELEIIADELIQIGKTMGTGTSKDLGIAEIRVFAYGKRVAEISDALSWMGTGAEDDLPDEAMTSFRSCLQHADEQLRGVSEAEAANG